MKTVNDLVAQKNNKNQKLISPYETVFTAIQKMSEEDLGALIVIDNDEIVGLFSERDYARKLLLHGKSSLETLVYEVMSTKVLYVTPDYTLEECLALMCNKHLPHLPVIENGKIIELITLEDVAFSLIDEKEFMIASLTQYIAGSPFFNHRPTSSIRFRELFWSKGVQRRKHS